MAEKEKIAVASHLTDSEYHLFLKTYALHNSSMGLEERKDYTLSHIVKVERNKKENCFNVHYENGDWWHYTPSGKWY